MHRLCACGSSSTSTASATSSTSTRRAGCSSVLRDDLGLTGTKLGCGEGACGACAVLLDGTAGQLVPRARRRRRRTPRSSRSRASRPTASTALQRAFIAEDGLQCGFCTPGQIVTATALLAANPQPDARADPRRDERQPLPLRRLPEDRARRAARGRGGVAVKKIRKGKMVYEGFEFAVTAVYDEADEWLPAVGRRRRARRRRQPGCRGSTAPSASAAPPASPSTCSCRGCCTRRSLRSPVANGRRRARSTSRRRARRRACAP